MSKLIVITAEELETIFDARLRAALERYAPQSKPRQPDAEPGEAGQTYVSKRQAARLLDCSPSTVDNAARAGKLCRHYVGKSVRFLRSEVLGLAKANTNHKQKSFNNER
jgi:excisionase family DNA binding protein